MFGVFVDFEFRKFVVLVLWYDNLNLGGNLFVKFDGIELMNSGEIIFFIDVKLKLVIFNFGV